MVKMNLADIIFSPKEFEELRKSESAKDKSDLDLKQTVFRNTFIIWAQYTHSQGASMDVLRKYSKVLDRLEEIKDGSIEMPDDYFAFIWETFKNGRGPVSTFAVKIEEWLTKIQLNPDEGEKAA